MRRFPISVCSLAVLALAGARLPAQAPHGPRLHVLWEGTLELAKARARRIGRPILVSVLRPSERFSQQMLDEIYPLPHVHRLMREFVCIAASEDATAPIESGPRKGKSVVFGTMTSAEHVAVHKFVREKLFGQARMVVPQHLFLDADGHLIERHDSVRKPEQLTRILTRLLDRVDPSWRPKEQAVAKARGAGDAGILPWADLFEADKKKRARAVTRLLAEESTDVVLTMFKQLKDLETRTLILEGARRSGKKHAGKLAVAALDDSESRLRAQAAVTAQAVGSAELLPMLTARFKKEKDSDVSYELLRAIGTSAHGNSKALKIIVGATKSRDERTRANAYVTLGIAGGHSNATASKMADVLISKGLRDRDTGTRSAAAWALGEIRSKRALSHLEKAMKRTRRRRRSVFAEAIKRINGETVPKWDDIRRRVARESLKR